MSCYGAGTLATPWVGAKKVFIGVGGLVSTLILNSVLINLDNYGVASFDTRGLLHPPGTIKSRTRVRRLVTGATSDNCALGCPGGKGFHDTVVVASLSKGSDGRTITFFHGDTRASSIRVLIVCSGSGS